MTLRLLALLLGPLLGSWSGADAPDAQPSADAPAEDSPATTPAAEAQPAPGGEQEHAQASANASEDDEAEPVVAAQVVDVVLPCGLRVITAKDASLPVAAVVLSLEIGTRDDPEKLPGLVHALAYHLQQGNRELAPGEAIATAHDAGGLAAMAVGHAQVRFESLVPISQLDATLRVEALRLRAPNTGRELWLKSLSYARNDDGVKTLVPREAAAAAWQDPGLNHDGRVVVQALGDMLDQAVGAQLSRLYDYRIATLVVVGPDEPQALLERVEPLFADLPARPRKQIAPAVTPPAAGTAPRVVRVARQKGDSLLWAVPGNPSARAWAQVLCGTLNRQQRGPNLETEPPKARLRCTYADDPRRPLLLLRAIGFDPAVGPEPLIAGRLARIAAVAQDPTLEPALADLVEAQRARIETDIGFDLRTPLELASYLASATERRTPASAGLPLRPRDELIGLPLLPDAPPPVPAPEPEQDSDELDTPTAVSAAAAASLVAAIPELLDTRRAVLLLDPEQPVPPAFHADTPSASEAADPPSPGWHGSGARSEAERDGGGDAQETGSKPGSKPAQPSPDEGAAKPEQPGAARPEPEGGEVQP